MLIAIGITSIIGLQALINIAVVTNTIPVTGMPLPFFSYGGTAILVDVAAVGLLLSVSRNSKKSTNEKSNRKL
jgi:cell division protein FtsW